MKEPPPDDEKGVARAATPTTPDRASTENQISREIYPAAMAQVKAWNADAGALVRAPGAASALETLRALASSRAEAFYFVLCQALTGREIDGEVKKRQDDARELLVTQSFRIADALESQGIRAYGPSKLSLVGVLSGESIEIPDFRNIVFIPLVAQRKRNQMLKQLEYFVQAHPFSRMWVFTTGERTPLHAIRDRIGWLHRRISKLNAQPFMQAAGASIVFRSTELGEISRDESDAPTFHVHAHVIVHLKRKLQPAAWRHLLASVRGWWRFHFKEARQVHKVRETCKYVVKPAELEELKAPELVELHHQLFRLHLVQCLGELKGQRKELEETRRCLVRIPGKELTQLKALPKWNGGGSRKELDERPKFHDKPPQDWVVANLPPSNVLTTRAEPVAVVMNYTGGDFPTNRRVAALREICGPLFPSESGKKKLPDDRRGVRLPTNE
ncbi:hypothetical protein [Haloferula sp.]|uniref:hypothetical protein n=1 Tax=Haloferula sp. TaxID=2497595 RepID=UPI003C71E772